MKIMRKAVVSGWFLGLLIFCVAAGYAMPLFASDDVAGKESGNVSKSPAGGEGSDGEPHQRQRAAAWRGGGADAAMTEAAARATAETGAPMGPPPPRSFRSRLEAPPGSSSGP